MLKSKIIAALAGLLVVTALVAGAGWKGYGMGRDTVQAQWDRANAELEADHNAEIARLEAVNRKVEVRYVPRIQYIQGETRTITNEVTHYVTAEDDTRCDIPDGFERLHDTAALGEDGVSTDSVAGSVDGAAAGPETPALLLSDVGRAVSGNYGACRVYIEQLRGLQEWAAAIADRAT